MMPKVSGEISDIPLSLSRLAKSNISWGISESYNILGGSDGEGSSFAIHFIFISTYKRNQAIELNLDFLP